MKHRPYTTRQGAVRIFTDLLNVIARRGWFMAGPSVEDGLSVLYVSFHLHPDDADRIFALLQKAIPIYGGSTEWKLERHQQNRFFLWPRPLAAETSKSGNFVEAANVLRTRFPELERVAASDLIAFSDLLYKLYLEERASLK